MPANIDQRTQEALKLPSAERALLAERILSSLGEVDPSTEEVWLVEAERRYQAYREGRLSSRPV